MEIFPPFYYSFTSLSSVKILNILFNFFCSCLCSLYFSIFESEVFELKDIVCDISSKINKLIIHDFPEVYSTKKLINMKEEELLNEITDVLLTTARLIKTFNLEEPLIEMIGYKYYRQFIREEKIKNHQKITR